MASLEEVSRLLDAYSRAILASSTSDFHIPQGYQGEALPNVRVNTSSSLPLGLYTRTDQSGAGLVEFCPSEPYASLSRDRRYRMRGFTCPDHAAPLLKPVIARVGDTVQVSPAGLAVNGRLLPNTAPLPRDAANRPLNPWPSGIYRFRPGTIWVASTYSRASYDSRYIGPVEEKSIRGRLKPLWLLH